MPRQLQTAQDLQKDQDRKTELSEDLRVLDEELALFDENGPWRFFQERLTHRLANSWEALTYCKSEEIAQHRAVIGVVRDLLLLPDALRERRAELVKELESYD